MVRYPLQSGIGKNQIEGPLIGPTCDITDNPFMLWIGPASSLNHRRRTIQTGDLRVRPLLREPGRAVAWTTTKIHDAVRTLQIDPGHKVGTGPRAFISKLQILVRVPGWYGADIRRIGGQDTIQNQKGSPSAVDGVTI